MDFETILYEQKNGVGVITLNRPDRLNAINAELKREVAAVLDLIEVDDAVGAVILNGSGRAFSTGMDLKDDAVAGTTGAAAWRAVLEDDLNFIMRFWDFPKPTIAVAHGYCLAAACELAMACDVTIAEDGCYFGEPELKFGSVITAMVMPFLTGPKLAKELLLGADDRVSAERAAEIGLVNKVVPTGTGLAAAMDMGGRMAVMDADAMRLTKRAINAAFDAMGLREALSANLELAVEIEATETPSRQRFKEIAAAEGLKAALAWRDGRLKRGGA